MDLFPGLVWLARNGLDVNVDFIDGKRVWLSAHKLDEARDVARRMRAGRISREDVRRDAAEARNDRDYVRVAVCRLALGV